jgi:hypothetical protein
MMVGKSSWMGLSSVMSEMTCRIDRSESRLASSRLWFALHITAA